MRRFVSVMLLLGLLALAGCGGGGDSGSALDSALSVLPKDTPFAVAIDTDIDGDQWKALDKLVGKFPFSGQIKNSLRQQLEQSGGGVSFDDDIKPVLGNPLVVGASGASGSSDVVAAVQAKDKGKLDDLISKTKAQKTGEASGATLYKDGNTVFAVKDDLLVFANNEAQLKSALARIDGDHLDQKTFNDSLSGLPDSALARVYVDVEALLKSNPSAADARRVKWIAALRQVGATVTAKDNALDIDFRARTEGDLSDGGPADRLGRRGAAGDQAARRDRPRHPRSRAHRPLRGERGPGDRPVRVRRLRAGQEDDRQAARGEPRRRPDRAAHAGTCRRRWRSTAGSACAPS